MKRTTLAYYNGAYGPTVLIDVHLMSWLVLLRHLIRNLMDDVIDRIDFLQLENIEVSNISAFILVKSAKRSYPCADDLKAGSGILELTWALDFDQLCHVIGLIDRLIECDSAGHQYLTDDDRLVIELSYKECHMRG